MKIYRVLISFIFIFSIGFVNVDQSNAGFDIPIPDSDSNYDGENYGLTAFF